MLVDEVCARIRSSTGVQCEVRRREHRHGYKAGALEQGRKETAAEFVAIFDSDFLPPADFLLRTIPHFYTADGLPEPRLALVQTQWGHLNHDQSKLTLAQSLWVDDHHTLQMSWRSGPVGVRELHRHRGCLADLGDRIGRRLARRQPCRGLRAQFPAPVRGLPHQVRQGDRHTGRVARHLHRLQGAAEALDSGLGSAATPAPSDSAVRIPLLAAPSPSLGVSHVRLVAVARVGAVDVVAALHDSLWPMVRLTVDRWDGPVSGAHPGVDGARGRAGVTAHQTHLSGSHQSRGVPAAVRPCRAVSGHQYGNASAPVQFVLRGPVRPSSQRVRTNTEGGLG